jgi:oligopeptide transport system substrate-binding protein
MVPPGMPGYSAPESDVRFDVRAARKLLAEAGFEGGRGFPEIGILFNTFEAHRKIAEVIADQLRRHLHLKVEAYNQEWQSYLATRRALDYDLARAGWVGDYLDPNTFLDMWVTNSGNNDTGFASADYDFLVRSAGNVARALTERDRLFAVVDDQAGVRRLIEQSEVRDLEAQKAARARLRMALLREAEAILVRQEFPVIPIYFYVNSGLISPQVRGLYPTLELPDGSQAPNLKDRHPFYAIEKVD